MLKRRTVTLKFLSSQDDSNMTESILPRPILVIVEYKISHDKFFSSSYTSSIDTITPKSNSKSCSSYPCYIRFSFTVPYQSTATLSTMFAMASRG